MSPSPSRPPACCRARPHRPAAGVTLIELMVVLAVTGILLLIAVPSFQEMLQMQRLRGTQAQLITDLQLARSTAVAQGQVSRSGTPNWQSVYLGVRPTSGGLGCYIIFTDALNRPGACNCAQPAGSRCIDTQAVEIKTVLVPSAQGVRLSVPAGSSGAFEFSPVTGGPAAGLDSVNLTVSYTTGVVEVLLDAARTYRTTVSATGRPSTCVPAGSPLGGEPCT